VLFTQCQCIMPPSARHRWGLQLANTGTWCIAERL
jgi:hypothetical protein